MQTLDYTGESQPGANTLAYHGTESVTVVKRFSACATRCNVIEPVFFCN
jgi:hypothetical protein